MWFIPPKLPPLNLRLRHLDGGGSWPSQFFGVTEDDRPIFIHYRGGYLSIDQGEVGASESDPKTELLSAKVGPNLHGTILREQACELLGLHLPGLAPLTTETLRQAQTRERFLDLSGATAFWSQFLLGNVEDLPEIISALKDAAVDLSLLTSQVEGTSGLLRKLDEGNLDVSSIIVGFGGNDEATGRLIGLPPSRVSLDASYLVLLNITRMLGVSGKDAPPEEQLPAHHPYFLNMECPVADGDQRVLAHRIVAAIESCVETVVDKIDITNDAFLGHDPIWHSRSLATWCRQETGRFLRVMVDHDDPQRRKIGWRSLPL